MLAFTQSCQILAVTAILIFHATAQSLCYLPDGLVAYGDTPCGTTLPAQCCPSGNCLSNGLCFVPEMNVLSRSSCTDQTWASDACTSICRTVNPASFETVLSCGGGQFCCPPTADSSPDSCCSSGATFALPAGNMINAAATAVDAASTMTFVSTFTEISTQVSTDTAQNTQVTSVITTLSMSTATTIVTTIQTSMASASTGTNSAAESSGATALNSSSKSSTCMQESALVGAGVGAPLLAALTIVSYFLYRARRTSTKRNSLAIGASNLASNRKSSLYTVPSRVNISPMPGIPPRVPARPASALLPFSEVGGNETYGRRLPYQDSRPF